MRKKNNPEQRRLLMLNEPIGKVITKMAFPTIVAFLITSIYSLADTYFVSLWGGDNPAATAAVSVNDLFDVPVVHVRAVNARYSVLPL